METKKFLFLLLYFLLPVPLIAAFYFETFQGYRTGSSIGLSAIGIIAYVWFCLEFVLMARPKILDQVFGMDKILKFHIQNSILMVILSVLHARLLRVRALPYGFQVRLGSGSLLLYILLIALGFIFMVSAMKNKARYDVSKIIHNITMIATVFLYFHLMLASTTRHSPLLQVLYSVYFFGGLAFWIDHKFIRPIRIKKYCYEIIDVVPETRDIWTLVLKPMGSAVFSFKAGQYCYLTIDAPGFSKEPHPFSFSSSSTKREALKITIKELGDYTKEISKVPKGAKAYLDGPYGIFTLDRIKEPEAEIIMIAGGVGITPFLSHLEELLQTEPTRKITFIYGVRTPKDIIRSKEFEEMQKRMLNFKVIPVVSDDDTWVGECGFIDEPRLQKLGVCEDIDPKKQNKVYFVCGPPQMLRLVLKSLRSLKVPSDRIFVEAFS
jgi:predicted ferric reductase